MSIAFARGSVNISRFTSKAELHDGESGKLVKISRKEVREMAWPIHGIEAQLFSKSAGLG
jgi:hypothetical protein